MSFPLDSYKKNSLQACYNISLSYVAITLATLKHFIWNYMYVYSHNSRGQTKIFTFLGIVLVKQVKVILWEQNQSWISYRVPTKCMWNVAHPLIFGVET